MFLGLELKRLIVAIECRVNQAHLKRIRELMASGLSIRSIEIPHLNSKGQTSHTALARGKSLTQTQLLQVTSFDEVA